MSLNQVRSMCNAEQNAEIYNDVLYYSSHFGTMQPWFWFMWFVIDWAGKRLLYFYSFT